MGNYSLYMSIILSKAFMVKTGLGNTFFENTDEQNKK